MKIVDFEAKHVEEALVLSAQSYNEEREQVAALPVIDTMPDLTYFANNGLGVAAFENGKMTGFLSCYEPFDNAFGTSSKGMFSPIHAHAAIMGNRSNIMKRLYQAAAHKWVGKKAAYHTIALYAHDAESKSAMFEYGFGLRCIDAIRSMDTFECESINDGIAFEELPKGNEKDVRELRKLLAHHVGRSPCFMYKNNEKMENWIKEKEEDESRLFVAKDGQRIVSFIEVADEGENFVTDVSSMLNICGAFCMPEYRGKSIVQNLINYTIKILKSEGYKILGVDYEGFNPTANSFWKKYFTVYTNSVVRTIDDCALHD